MDQHPGQKNTTSKNLLGLGTDTLDIADAALAALIAQEEKISNGQKNLGAMQDDLNDTNSLIRSIQSFWGQITNAFVPNSSGTNAINARKDQIAYQSELNTKFAQLEAEHDKKDRRSPNCTPNDDTEQDLVEFLGMVSDMKLRAQQLNVVIDSSNSRLNKLKNNVDDTGSKVVSQRAKFTKL